jgi:hypothetical protein
VQSFPLLRTVAEISGVFGEETLQEFATRLADSATQFAVLRGAFRVDGSSLSFDELVLESKDFLLRGEGGVDLVSAALRGDAAMIFSKELSERMREEGSRAGELFANSDTGLIALPLALRGALSDPSAMVDWESAVKSYAGRRVEREVERQVGRLLDRILTPKATPTPSPPR